jgi:hypothetical protein
VAFLDPALVPLSQASKRLGQMRSEFLVHRLASTLRNENNIIFALPLGVT